MTEIEEKGMALWLIEENLYDILGLTKPSSEAEIKKTYYRLALKYHPDRLVNGDEQEREEAKKKFQKLGFAYAILSDEKKKKLYDKSGVIDEHGSDVDWNEYLSSLYKKVTADLIDEFSGIYKNSEEEREDLINLYKKYKGDMGLIIDSLLMGCEQEEDRYRSIIGQAIEEGVLKRYKAFFQVDKREKMRRMKRARQEAKEAAELAKELGLNNSESLEITIRQKTRKNVDWLTEKLINKYAANEEKPDICDSEFEKLQEKLFKKK